MYKNKVGFMDGVMAAVKGYVMKDTIGDIAVSGRLILKGGHVVDPKNQVDTVTDILIGNGVVCQVGDDIQAESGDRIIDCEGLLVLPGLIDMHLHLGDLFDGAVSSGGRSGSWCADQSWRLSRGGQCPWNTVIGGRIDQDVQRRDGCGYTVCEDEP